jgi:GH15 family glucan-1,4-alpha-glucosidase
MSLPWLMRIDGYLPIRGYAIVGDGRTTALIGTDGAIDWLCFPNIDSPSVFGRLLDAGRGGSFILQPTVPFQSRRRYIPDTNVLETTFETERGAVRVTDAMTLPAEGLAPMRELARSIEGVSGSVPMRWRFSPRAEYGLKGPRFERRSDVPIATWANRAIAVCHWQAGTPQWSDGGTESDFDVSAGERALLAIVGAFAEPLVMPGRADVLRRLDRTVTFWRQWARGREYQGPWDDRVRRSALALKLLIFAPSGAISAAPTTSLPEEIGGERNWDYRYCWIRDSNFIVDALLELGCYDEARSLFWWFLQATALTEPEVHVLYRLDGGVGPEERTLPLSGYRHSVPVRIGNGALEQLQLDIYGHLLETAWLYSEGHHRLDRDTGAVLGRIADHVGDIWRQPDSGIWEVRNGPFHFTHSKVMCWVALDRAVRLANRGELPDRHAARWRSEASAIHAFVEQRCWSDRLHSYTRTAGDEQVDASLLMLPTVGYGDPRGDRINGTIDAVCRDLAHGDFVYRYHADDGVAGDEGCFLNCSFWLVSALARAGRLEEASSLMGRLVSRASDVGLYSEEIDPSSGEFLGNFPQALTHLALIDAAVAIRDGDRGPREPRRR